MAANLQNLDAAGFDAAIAGGVTLVDFWAPWCGPCRLQGPILEQVAEALAGKAKVAKVDVDAHSELASRFDISGIPAFLVFKDGVEAARLDGLQQKDALLAAVERQLG